MSRTLQIISDVHLEHRVAGDADATLLPAPVADILVLAGDIGNVHSGSLELKQYLHEAASRWRHVLYVPGNHEYYGTTRGRADRTLHDIGAGLDNLHILFNGKVVEIETPEGPQRFVGSTLWSSPVTHPRVNDFEKIYSDIPYPDGQMKKLTLEEFRAWNEEAKAFLAAEVRQDDIVITHFLPLMNEELPNFGIKSKYAVDPTIDSYFGNRGLWSPFSKCKLWISGHTHQAFDGQYTIYPSKVPTRWICNPIGYPGEIEAPNYQGVVVDLKKVV